MAVDAASAVRWCQGEAESTLGWVMHQLGVTGDAPGLLCMPWKPMNHARRTHEPTGCYRSIRWHSA